MSCGRYKIQCCPLAGFIRSFNLIIKPVAQVFEIHPGIVKTLHGKKRYARSISTRMTREKINWNLKLFFINRKATR